ASVHSRLEKPSYAGAARPRAVDCLKVVVSDTGIGIHPKDHQRIFFEFEQVDSSYGRQQQGTGLGLALTKRIIEMHGGRIWVESEGIENRGSIFRFVLPFNQAPKKPDEGSLLAELEQLESRSGHNLETGV